MGLSGRQVVRSAPMTTVNYLSARFSRWYWMAKTQGFYRHALGSLGWRSLIIKPLNLVNLQNVFIGADVAIHKYAWLLTSSAITGRTPRLDIGDGSDIGNFNHITCVDRVEIGTKVLTADRVYISDHGHGFENPDVPIMDQPVVSKGPVVIGAGSWLGENVCVLSCRIGRNCVIAANAVVTRDIPDFCVAAGIPARVIKRFDPATRTWQRV